MATLDEVISQMSEEDYFSDQIQFIIDSNLRIVSVPDFCVVVLSSNTAYTEQTKATLMLTDQQDNINGTKSIGNLENNQVLTLIGADDASLFPWAVLNNTMNSSTITKIKYIGFFDFKNYSAIMSNIIN